ncbi:MAG: hypothetical protein KA137_06385 [Halioglobus sp.]|nr:hypothetical protein [Halioglobus sp.]
MSAGLAIQRYLQRHIEPGLPPSPQPLTPWRHVLVIPAYREHAALVQRLRDLPAGAGQALVILVLNRPDSDAGTEANGELRAAVLALPAGSCADVRELNARADLYLLDLDAVVGPLPAAQGVGLARKYGCDLAFKWMSEGAISDRWLCGTDADATLPPGYFLQLEQLPAGAAGATFPFWHAPGEDESCSLATALYELRLHHYVRGLEYAGSPYAFHTIGSCLAVSFEGYAQVRGFPKRAGAEDFYLLNKLAKTGPVIRLAGDCIELASRHSQRAPFGTGPAVARISNAEMPLALPLFYHPACFAALRTVLAAAAQLAQQAAADLATLLAAHGLDPLLRQACCNTLDALGLAAALQHCHRQGRTPEQFLRQFHQWFDGFRTLRFIHGIRDAGWPNCSLAGLDELTPGLWPPGSASGIGIAGLRRHIGQYWGWTRQAG